MAKLVVFGAGDIARLAHVYFSTDSPHEVVAFVVDRPYLHADTFERLPLIAFDELVARYPPEAYQVFVAMSYAEVNGVRAGKFEACKRLGYALPSYVSSRCTWLTAMPPGENCFILENNTIQPFVTIDDDVTLWSGNHIGHDSRIEAHTFVASHVVVSGHVHVGPRCFLGVNATLRDGITVGERSIIGAGAIVMEDVPAESVLVARPATRLSRRSDVVDL